MWGMIEDMGYAILLVILVILLKYILKGLGKLFGVCLEHHHH